MKPIQKNPLSFKFCPLFLSPSLEISRTILFTGLFLSLSFGLALVSQIESAHAQTGSYSEADTYNEGDESIYPVRLDLNLLDVKTRIIGSSIIPEIQDISSTTQSFTSSMSKSTSKNQPYTMVETIYTARARAFGGDVYLPAYREDIVSEAIITVPEEGSNAVVPSLNTVEILRALPQAKGKYLLHEYEEATLRIKVVYKVLPKAMPPRLVFATRLNTVLWYPAAYENGQNDPGLDPETGNRLIQIPLINATYIPQQVTRVGWQTEPVVLLRDNKNLRANVSGIFDKLRTMFK